MASLCTHCLKFNLDDLSSIINKQLQSANCGTQTTQVCNTVFSKSRDDPSCSLARANKFNNFEFEPVLEFKITTPYYREFIDYLYLAQLFKM